MNLIFLRPLLVGTEAGRINTILNDHDLVENRALKGLGWSTA